ncbi:hypothetical protein RIF29_38362 [Crotalaria pallida]|uniref:Uncharacterized protein n=1 Tax=Crotalaria pallida TaxID=3830 RepID=A0AAN9DZS9_CROPI
MSIASLMVVSLFLFCSIFLLIAHQCRHHRHHRPSPSPLVTHSPSLRESRFKGSLLWSLSTTRSSPLRSATSSKEIEEIVEFTEKVSAATGLHAFVTHCHHLEACDV